MLATVCIVVPLILAASGSGVPGAGGRVRAAASPAPPRGTAAPGAGPQHLGVLRAPRRRRGRWRRTLREDCVRPRRCRVRARDGDLRAGLALLASLAPSLADGCTWPPTRSWQCCRASSPCSSSMSRTRPPIRRPRRPAGRASGSFSTAAAASCSTGTPRTRATGSTSCAWERTGGRTRRADAPLADYAGFGWPVLAPADGRVVAVADGFADTPPGISGDRANHLVIDIGDGRFVALAHLQQGSVTVRWGTTSDRVSSSQRSATPGTPTSRTCTCRSRTPPQGSTLPALPHRVPRGRHHSGRGLALGRRSGTTDRRPHPGSADNECGAGSAYGAAWPRLLAGDPVAVGTARVHESRRVVWNLSKFRRPQGPRVRLHGPLASLASRPCG